MLVLILMPGSTPGQDLISRNNFFTYFKKLLKLNIGFRVRLGLVLDYFVLYRVCRVDGKRLSSWPHSCAGRSNQLSRGVVLSQSTLYLVVVAQYKTGHWP